MRIWKLTPVMTGAVAVTLLLTSCGGGGGDGSTEASEDCPDGVTTLSVLKPEGSMPHPELLEAYQEHGDLCVEFDVDEVPFGQLAEQISVLAASGAAPDIVGYDSPNTAAYAHQGLLLPLDEYLADDWEDDVLPSMREQVSWEGSVYSPGVNEDSMALFYNKTMTDGAGIDVPSSLDEAWTWEEAQEAFQQCQVEEGGSISVYGLAPSRLGEGTPGAIYRDLLFLRSAGDPEAEEDSSAYRTFWGISEDGTEVDGWLNTPEAIEAAEFYQGLFEGPGQVTTSTAIPNALIDENACFDIEVMNNLYNLEDANPDFEWDVAPLPYFETPIVHTGAVTIGVMANAENAEVAAEVVAGMGSTDVLSDLSSQRRLIPALRSSIDQVDHLEDHPESLFVDQIEEWGQPRPLTVNFTEYNEYVQDALRDTAYGSDAEATLDRAVDQLDPILGQ